MAEKVRLDIKAQGYPGLAYLTPMQARGLMVGFLQQRSPNNAFRHSELSCHNLQQSVLSATMKTAI
jgi:hypothetical protein